MRLDTTSHGYHFPAERLSFSQDAKLAMTEIAKTGKKAMAKALCVLIKHITVTIPQLRLILQLVRTRQESLCASLKNFLWLSFSS